MLYLSSLILEIAVALGFSATISFITFGIKGLIPSVILTCH